MTRPPLFLIVLVALLTIRAAHALDIHNDTGGDLKTHTERFASAQKPIRILGPCYSACTLALAYSSTCVGPKAVLGFHRPYGGRVEKANRIAAIYLMGQYPKRVRAWIRANGGLTARLLILRGKELHNIVRRCA